MLVQHVLAIVRDGQESAVEAALLDVRQRLFMTAGFRGFAVLQDAEQPSRYLIQVRWETVEELGAAVDSGRFERSWTPVEPFLAAPLRIEHYVERPGLGVTTPGTDADLREAFRDVSDR